MSNEIEDEELKRILEKKYREMLEELKKPKYSFGSPIYLNSSNFEQTLMKADLALVDFYADWCMPCKAMAPIIEELAKKYPNILFAKVNVDENPDLAMKFDISAIPTLIIFKKGKFQERVVGFIPKTILENILRSFLGI